MSRIEIELGIESEIENDHDDFMMEEMPHNRETSELEDMWKAYRND